MFFVCLFVAIVGTIINVIIFIIDKMIMLKRIKISQKEWDEYSFGKSFEWKINNFSDFLEENKNKHGWKYYYIPRIGF